MTLSPKDKFLCWQVTHAGFLNVKKKKKLKKEGRKEAGKGGREDKQKKKNES